MLDGIDCHACGSSADSARWTSRGRPDRGLAGPVKPGSKITSPVLDWVAVADSAARSDSRGFGVAGSFSQCAFALLVW